MDGEHLMNLYHLLFCSLFAPGGGTHADVKTPLTNKKSTEVAEVTE